MKKHSDRRARRGSRLTAPDGATDHQARAPGRGGTVDPTLTGIAAGLSDLMSFLQHRYMPQLWDYRDIAKWMQISETTVKMRVINQPGFPDPFIPTGNEDGHRRYFSDDVIAFARRRRGGAKAV